MSALPGRHKMRSVPLGGTARSAREQRASPGRPKARNLPLGGTARSAREQQ